MKFLNLALLGSAAEHRFKREGSILAHLIEQLSRPFSVDAKLVAYPDVELDAAGHLESALGPDHPDTQAARHLADGVVQPQ